MDFTFVLFGSVFDVAATLEVDVMALLSDQFLDGFSSASMRQQSHGTLTSAGY
jgi:hypothetical protein